MPRRQRTSVPEAPELFEDEEALPEELDIEVEDEGEAQQTTGITLADEPLCAALLRQAILKLWPDDTVMADFVTHVAGPLSALLGTYGAKGGDFVVQRMQAGLNVDGDYTHDQSFRAHLFNGLFPILHIAHLLK